MDYPQDYRAVDEAITSRRSVRAFLPKPVPKEVVEDILEVARRAPSGTNIQPWNEVHVLAGVAKAELSRRILAVHNDPAAASEHTESYPYYPTEWTSPYVERRRKVGWDMYGLLGIGKADRGRMHEQAGRNFLFFDAPVGMIFTIENVMRTGGWLDYGMFMQNIMVAARARGLDTCPQQAFSRFHRVISEVLAIPQTQTVICGMALGYADPQAAVNQLVTEREPVHSFTRFHGF